jgi:uncharacterized protein (TIGR04255 family)
MTRKFKNPPLTEILCEIRFEADNPYDATLPGLLYSEFKDEYPKRSQRNIGIANPLKDNQAEIVVSPLAQFYSEDNSLLVQVGANMLTVNCVKNYPHWEKFQPRIMKAFQSYVIEASPRSIIRIGLRVLNKIFIQGADVALDYYFKFVPTHPENIETAYSFFSVHVESPFEDSRDVLIMKNHNIISEKTNHIAFMLDLEYAMNQPGKLEVDAKQVEKWIELAHRRLNEAFIASLTEQQLDNLDK